MAVVIAAGVITKSKVWLRHMRRLQGKGLANALIRFQQRPSPSFEILADRP